MRVTLHNGVQIRISTFRRCKHYHIQKVCPRAQSEAPAICISPCLHNPCTSPNSTAQFRYMRCNCNLNTQNSSFKEADVKNRLHIWALATPILFMILWVGERIIKINITQYDRNRDTRSHITVRNKWWPCHGLTTTSGNGPVLSCHTYLGCSRHQYLPRCYNGSICWALTPAWGNAPYIAT